MEPCIGFFLLYKTPFEESTILHYISDLRGTTTFSYMVPWIQTMVSDHQLGFFTSGFFGFDFTALRIVPLDSWTRKHRYGRRDFVAILTIGSRILFSPLSKNARFLSIQ